MKIIKLNSPKYGEKDCFIDDEDWDLVMQYKWSLSFVRGNWYATCTKWSNGDYTNTKMHRLIMGVSGSSTPYIDHRDNNGLNNQKHNLRYATIGQNSRNVGKTIRNVSGYKGVYLYEKGRFPKKWVVRIKSNRKNILGGYFESAEEAAKKYNEMASKYHGEFAYLNKIPNE